MTEYLNYKFEDNETFINTFDEAPLWSAAFGILLLKHITLKHHQTIVDLGSGAGFPLLELAGRAGNTCKLYGIDPWKNANTRANQKIKNYGYTHIEIIESSAAEIPFEKNSIDLIVSNLGINNFENPNAVFNECARVLKPNGKLALTTNLTGHWHLFYEIFYQTLHQIGKSKMIEALKEEELHRGDKESISTLFTNTGFKINRVFEENFEMKFVDGTAFLNHYFIKLGWLSSWTNLFPKQDLQEIFTALEQNLNSYSNENDGLNLTVPMLFIEGEKLS
ncbi:MAG: methyltransferase domain-containing protein [Bacteroidia bacterium]|nr:methyltransferase domain-containing protein [Bacteroidia bacterium]